MDPDFVIFVAIVPVSISYFRAQMCGRDIADTLDRGHHLHFSSRAKHCFGLFQDTKTAANMSPPERRTGLSRDGTRAPIQQPGSPKGEPPHPCGPRSWPEAKNPGGLGAKPPCHLTSLLMLRGFAVPIGTSFNLFKSIQPISNGP